jgi:hypothetical protein
MDPRDRLPPFANGVDCGVCGQLVPFERIRVLASRDDLMFVELDCTQCKSESLGIIVESGGGEAGSDARYGEFLPADDARFREALPIGADDIRTVRELLERGDLAAFVGPSRDARGGGSRA